MDRCYRDHRVAGRAARPADLELARPQRLGHARALIAGDTDRAEQLATEALQIGTDGGQPDAVIVFGAQFMIVSILRGTLSELVPLIEQTVADSPNGLPVFIAALAMDPRRSGPHRGRTRAPARCVYDRRLRSTQWTKLGLMAETEVEGPPELSIFEVFDSPDRS